MSSEIVPALDGSESSSFDSETDQDSPVSDANRRKQPRAMEGVRPFDLLDLRAVGKPVFRADLAGGDYQIRQFLSSDKGHKHVTQLNPTPNSLKPLLEKIKEPSVLLLQGCDQLFSQPLRMQFPFEKFKPLTTLEICGCSHLATLPTTAISEMTQLQTLSLSHLPIQQIPADLLSRLTKLRSFILRECPNLRSLPTFPELTALHSLDLSHLLIETLPWSLFAKVAALRWVTLRGCSKLHSFPLTAALQKLEVLDLSHCTALKEFEYDGFWHRRLQMLDLSYTALPRVPTLNESLCITHLFLRDMEVTGVSYLKGVTSLQVLDLSGAQNVRQIDHVQGNKDLVALDLSRTGVESIDFLPELIHLRYLILKQCTELVRLPAVIRLTNLQVFDISGCEVLSELPEDLSKLRNLKELNLSRCSCLQELREGLFDHMSCLQILNLSETSVVKLPDMSKLVNLKELLLANCLELEVMPQLQPLKNLEVLDLSLPDNYTASRFHIEADSEAPGSLRKLLLGNRRGVLKLFPSESLAKLEYLDVHGADETDLVGENLQEGVQVKISKHNELHLVSTFMSNSGFERFKYEFTKVDDLVSNIAIAATTSNAAVSNEGDSVAIQNQALKIQADLRYILENIDLLESCHNGKSSEGLLNELMDAATHLSEDDFTLDSTNLYELLRMVVKLKLLLPPKQVVDLEITKKKNESRFTRSKNKEKVVVVDDVRDPPENYDLLNSYESLKKMEKNCLLCFLVFPCGKGLDENTGSSKKLVIKKRILIHWWLNEGFIEPKATEEAGKQILKVLEEKGFIEPVMNKRRESGSCSMQPSVHAFVTARAKEEGFFDFHHENGKLSACSTRFQRACLLKSQDSCPSSCTLWANYIHSSKNLEAFKTIRTLFNVNEPTIYIRSEWFSKMKDLCVLHLGSWQFEDDDHIEVVDQKFLEALKNMKQLRLLSLQGFSTIVKLPNSICKLTNLKVLNLRDCTYLEELPSDIGSLKNLTYLDLTNCPVLSKLPKGLSLLSKLEVLKGFVITYQIGGQQHRKACTLRELSKLESLRKLTLVVNIDKFPDSEDLQAFKEMKSLCNLEISWEKNYNIKQEPEGAIGLETSRRSMWQKLKCWEQQTRQNDADSSYLDNLQKLVLYCFPSEAAPNWLDPSKLHKLEKLYIVGGNLQTLPGDTKQNTWNVKNLRVKYLSNLNTDWPILSAMFPSMTYFEHHKCDKLTDCPPGVWIESDFWEVIHGVKKDMVIVENGIMIKGP